MCNMLPDLSQNNQSCSHLSYVNNFEQMKNCHQSVVTSCNAARNICKQNLSAARLHYEKFRCSPYLLQETRRRGLVNFGKYVDKALITLYSEWNKKPCHLPQFYLLSTFPIHKFQKNSFFFQIFLMMKVPYR
jgi:hypothetical protein